MSYLVFARKYRPQTFSEILGQAPIVTTLTNAIKQKRIGHAYLFTGPRGTGKTSTARIFAKSLNCVQGPTPAPCLKCERCQEIAQGRSMDVLEIDGASNRGIDQIRALREHSKFTPAAGAFKVYIIDEVHQITAEGFNALLKTLEEPPAHVLFVLATTAPHKVPSTILSRCQRYDFRRLSLEEIARKIKSIAEDEKLSISEDAVIGVARAASGSLRDAESILDQVASFAGGKIKGEDVQTLLGAIPEDVFVEAVQGILAREPVRLLKLVAAAADSGTDLIQWCLSFLTFLRNLLVAKVGAGTLGFEDLGPDAGKRLGKLAEQVPLEDLTAIAQSVTAIVDVMRRVGEPRIPLEMALVRLSAGESLVPVAELLERLDQLDQRLKEGAPAAPRPQPQASVRPAVPEIKAQPPASARVAVPQPPAAAQPSQPRVAPASGSPVQRLVSVWPEFIELVRQQKISAAAYLAEAGPVSVEPGDPQQVVIGFPKGFEFNHAALDRSPNRELLEQVLAQLLGGRVRCALQVVEKLPYAVENPVPPPSGPPQAQKPPEQTSLLNAVIDLFEGRVVPGTGEG